jgi:hypothetical protein
VDLTLCLDMEPVKIVERGGWKGSGKGAGKKMRRREGEWTTRFGQRVCGAYMTGKRSRKGI